MVFASVLFLFYFLPAVVFFYYISGRARNYVLLGFSLVFYLFGGVESFPLILISIVLNYLSGLFLGILGERQTARKILLTISVLANLGLLFYYKYFNFAGEVYSSLRTHLSFLPQIVFPQVTLPLGISFFTFQGMAYVIDVYRRETEAQKNISKVALYIAMFPQLIAGPIVRYSNVEKEMNLLSVKKGVPVNMDCICKGAVRFITGLGKKVILADVLAESVDRIFSMEAASISTSMAWFGIVAYGMQIYFDFSGYSDMAIGMGKILGYTFPENFDLPYTSTSIREFWRRWHMTLSSWFRDYLYFPLGGSRRGNVYFNIFIVFLCTGLWHGAAWTYVMWGAWHGLFMIIERVMDKRIKNKKQLPLVLRWLYCMLIINIGLAIFRSESLVYAWAFIKAMLGFPGGSFNYINILYFMNARTLFIFTVASCVSLNVPGILYRKLGEGGKAITRKMIYPAALALFAVSLFVVINGNYSPFIYFRF